MYGKHIAVAALLGYTNAYTPQNAEDLIKGILFGILKAEGFTDILKCVGDA